MAAAQPNPLANSSGAFRSFGGSAGQAARAAGSAAAGITGASRAVDRIRASTAQAGKDIKQFATGADAAGRAAGALGRAAPGAHTGVLKVKTGAQGATRELKNLKRNSDLSAKSIGIAGKGSGALGKVATLFGGNLRIAGAVMTAVNLVMKANPWVLVATLLAPFAEQLIEFALNSELGQQIMETVFATVGSLIETALTYVAPVVTGYLTVVLGFWKGLANVVKPALKWVTTSLPGAFRTVNSAMERALHGMGGFLESGFQMAVGVIKGPINGLIAFANWVIDGLNSLSFNFFGKHFGVDLNRIPMLAAGGIVAPRTGGVPVILAEAGEAEVVLPLSRLEELLARTAGAARAARTGHRTPRIENYHEPEGRGSYGIAEELLFLAHTT
ncbi:hypothetical protein GCM10010331_06190 [Streptomyces xanthochromogenes]|uniref:hypothetical protein n=1 Tax=Streptomyces xanthochromogenes TaxID=67384 RepID=UPI0016729CFE|nr:hypothetical protein [Streptomyces xanthochromogenes]GHB22690.1 hypothetical protein GCM10010331_06190 [Streptomyces xanthochromogenes]